MTTTSRSRRAVLLVLGVALAAGACHQPARTAAAPSGCDSVAAGVPSRDDLQRLPGTYRLTVVATAGMRPGAAATGRLELRRQADSLQAYPQSVQLVWGTTDLNAADVGAVAMGSAAANDARAPGVGVYVAPPAGEPAAVVMRVGAQSNTRGPQPIDAGHFSFFLRRVTVDGVWGEWRSGSGMSEVARGHFCARRA